MVHEHAVLGQVLKGRYAVEEIVGEGAFGRVYRASDLETGRRVALKEFIREHGRQDSFLRELGILFDLSHPNVVACESVVMSGKFRYLVCEYMDGGSLRGLLNVEETELEQLFMVFRSVCEAVAWAHDRGVMHRDLKPENILLAHREGALVAKVGDFGISTLGTDLGARSAIGSPAYMAPEQFCDQYDHRVDVYALGILLYELLHRRRPFSGSPAQLMAAHLRREPAIAAWIPKGFQRLLRRALAKKVEKRIFSVSQFMEEFERAVVAAGPRFDGAAWPLANLDVRSLAHTREEVWVSGSASLRRHDLAGRLLMEEAPCEEIQARGAFALLRRAGAVDIDLGGLRKRLGDVSPETRLALGFHGAVAMVQDEGLLVVEGARHNRVHGGGSGVTAAQFFGRDQNLAVALGGASPRLLLPRGEVPIPEPISTIYAHDDRRDLVLRASADGTRLYLVSEGRVTAVDANCGPLASDGDGFFAIGADGDLLSLHVASGRVARTRWETRLAHVSASEERLFFATSAGAVVAA